MDIHEPIKRDRNLNITVIADDSSIGFAAVSHGIMLAKVFQASLTVMANFGFAFGTPEFHPIPDHDLYLQNIRDAVSEVNNCQVITDYVFPETLFRYADEHNTAMFVIGVGDGSDGFFTVKKALKLIRQSRFPVMVVKCGVDEEDAKDWYKDILLPLDIERQNKEKALWAGYFSRFYGSTIHILYPKYKDEGLAKLVYDNVAVFFVFKHRQTNSCVPTEFSFIIRQRSATLIGIGFFGIGTCPAARESCAKHHRMNGLPFPIGTNAAHKLMNAIVINISSWFEVGVLEHHNAIDVFPIGVVYSNTAI